MPQSRVHHDLARPNTPELHSASREEQILQFNLARRELNLPKTDPEILRDLFVPLE